ncbi:MAG: hypothetical protein PWP64_681 [Candidatus Cloacimonadota bacterium]|nr:hypothetical protein [Candidatus Cloacimonadota bacterium]
MKKLISAKTTRNIALVGISKNSGKTSLLNAILAENPQLRWAVMTTGLDGEEKDRVFQTPKPQVALPAGVLFCCDAETLAKHGSKVELCAQVFYNGRKLYIAKSLACLQTQISGPASVLQQKKLIAHFRALGARKVLIDGALDRKSIALEDRVDTLILCVGASFGTLGEIEKELRRIIMLRDLSAVQLSNYQMGRLKRADQILMFEQNRWKQSGIKTLIRHEKPLKEILSRGVKALYIPTSFTDLLYDHLASDLAKQDLQIIFRHPECIKLNLANLQRFLWQNRVSCLIPFKIKAFALNSTAIGKEAIAADRFRDHIRKAFPEESFYDIMEV